MELAEKGSLETVLQEQHDLPWATRLIWLEDCCGGLDHLHSSFKPPLAHRDLKPANVLIRGDGHAILCDFGLAKFLDSKKFMSVAGTLAYQAPEIRTQKTYSVAVDVWSLGMLMYELLTHEKPYQRDSLAEAEQKISSGTPPEIPSGLDVVKNKKWMQCVPVGYVALMKRCYSLNPASRPSCKELIASSSALRLVTAFICCFVVLRQNVIGFLLLDGC